jgi:protein-tyrosine phosphatase
MSVIIDNLILSSISEIRNNNEMARKTKLHINAAEEVDCKFKSNGLVRIELNWNDDPLQNINENGILFHIVKMMDSYLRGGNQVLVNCFAGVSRSTTIVIAYLMYKNKWNVQDTITFVRSKRNIINPNFGFICQLYKLQDMLHTLDENFNQYCSNIQNKNHDQLLQEITDTCDIPFIKDIRQRDIQGFSMPIPPTVSSFSHISHISSFPSLSSSSSFVSNPYVHFVSFSPKNQSPNVNTYYD